MNFRELENRACAKARGVVVPEAWDELIDGARTVLAQQMSTLSTPVGHYDSQTNALMAAARTLDAAAQWMPSRDKSDREAQRETGLLAALSFGAGGNFPSASAVLRRTFPTLRPHTPQQAALMAVACPALLSSIAKHCPSEWLTRSFFELFSEFLQTGEADPKVLYEAWHACLSDEQSLNNEVGQWCLEQAFALSTARVLAHQSTLMPDYAVRLSRRVPLLMPPQKKAIEAGILESGNALIALPPGTGKTLLGELCLMSSLGEDAGLAVFLAPYVALGRQVARSLQGHLPPNIRVRRHLGGHCEDELQPHTRAEILVATPEKLDGLLRTQPHLIPHLKIVVCDEAHLIGGDARGARLEGLLSRLRLLQSVGHPLRIVALSAALGRSGALCDWLQTRVFCDDWRPTARRVALWTGDGKLTWRDGDDVSGNVSHDSFALDVAWPSRLSPTDRWPAVERQRPALHSNAAVLARHLNESLGGTVLCVCATRRGTRQMAAALAPVFAPREPHGALAQAIEIIEKRHRVLRPLAAMLRCGVAWHNAGLPHDVRSLIEEAIEGGELEAVAATTTLAEGADFPFRATVLVDWLHWNGNGQQPLSPQLFRNIAGRCGRAGAFTEGDTVLVDNPLGDLAYTAPDVRRGWQQSILAAPPDAPQSTLELLSDTSAQAETLRATLASQFVAAIAENPDTPAFEQQFLSHLYATQRGADLHAQLQIITQQLEDSGLAQRDTNGAWTLTDLGCAINASELSPATGLHLLHTLRELPSVALPTNLSTRIAFVGARLLRAMGACPEQSHADLKAVLQSKRSRFCVKPDDFEMVLGRWLRGESAATIFGALPFALRSSRQIDVEEWVEGDAQDEDAATWQNELDKFVDFSRHVLEVFLPHLLRASARLSPFTETTTLLPWPLAAQFVEAGVDSRGALELLSRNTPGTRLSIAALARHDGDLVSALKEVGGKYCDDGQNLLEAWQWLQENQTSHIKVL